MLWETITVETPKVTYKKPTAQSDIVTFDIANNAILFARQQGHLLTYDQKE